LRNRLWWDFGRVKNELAIARDQLGPVNDHLARRAWDEFAAADFTRFETPLHLVFFADACGFANFIRQRNLMLFA
jgi:hypothetical protein